jgi:hypothetical protein
MNSKLSISPERLSELSPTTRNLISILEDIPVMILKRNIDSGKNRRRDVYEELKSLSGSGFQVFENETGITLILDGSARSFLV